MFIHALSSIDIIGPNSCILYHVTFSNEMVPSYTTPKWKQEYITPSCWLVYILGESNESDKSDEEFDIHSDGDV